jgi:hypothetical protein
MVVSQPFKSWEIAQPLDPRLVHILPLYGLTTNF